jgi:8-oxo-dGTP diphosphatase
MQDKWTGIGGKTRPLEESLESCIREVKEETGLDIREPELRGVVSTINISDNSKWLLSVYAANQFCGELSECNEGKLEWVKESELYKKNLIGFIRKMLPYVLDKSKTVFTGKFIHNNEGDIQSYILRRENNILESE